MLEAMQASRDCAPAFEALASTQTWMSGVTVAQLMKSLPLDRLNNPPLKTAFMALSSDTTVMMTSDSFVTRRSSSGATAPSSFARDSAAARFRSCTAVISNPQSFRRRAMLEPMRPTPTKPIFMRNPFVWGLGITLTELVAKATPAFVGST